MSPQQPHNPDEQGDLFAYLTQDEADEQIEVEAITSDVSADDVVLDTVDALNEAADVGTDHPTHTLSIGPPPEPDDTSVIIEEASADEKSDDVADDEAFDESQVIEAEVDSVEEDRIDDDEESSVTAESEEQTNEQPIEIADEPPLPPLTLRPPRVKRQQRRKPILVPDNARRALIVGRIAVGMITVAMLGLLGRVIQLQTQPPEPIARLVDSQFSSAPIEARRGDLRARDGRPLAVSRMVSQLFVDPALIDEPATYSERIAFSLNYDPVDIERQLSSRMHTRFVVLDPHLTDDRLAVLSKLRLPGLGTQPRFVREYPQGPLAAPVIGFVGMEGKGLEGLERSLESELRGESGQIRYLRDAARQPLWVPEDGYEPHRDGRSIYLTLDLTIQAIAEEELAAACRKYNAKSGELIVMDPHTGEILAMANYPSFDPRDLSNSDPDARRNRCVTDVFEPGSIFKPFIWAVATEERFAHPGEVINAHNGLYVSPRGRRLRDAHGYDRLTWEEALVKSSNIVMAIVAQRMGEKRVYEAVRSFGFGSRTGSELPGEVAGLVHPLNRWTHYSITSVPMGQEVGVTPLQLTTAFCAFGNDGLLITPSILLPQQPDEERPRPRIVRRVLSPSAAELTRRTMRKVVTDGTGRNAKSDLYTIFGKTGTAQVAGKRGGYLPGQYIGSFVGGAPTEHPRIIVGCFIHQPDAGRAYYGGIIAAPVVRNVIERSLLHMGVPPSSPNTLVRANR